MSEKIKATSKNEKYDELILTQQVNIKKLEKEISMLKKNIERYSESLRKSRKRNDEVSSSIGKIVLAENGKFKNTLEKFSNILVDVGEYKNKHVSMIYDKVEYLFHAFSHINLNIFAVILYFSHILSWKFQ